MTLSLCPLENPEVRGAGNGPGSSLLYRNLPGLQSDRDAHFTKIWAEFLIALDALFFKGRKKLVE